MKAFFNVFPFLFNSLFNLYNLLENPYSRFFVYMKALNLAVNGKVTEHIIPSFKKIDSFLKEWNIDIKDKRALFLGIANVLKESRRYKQRVNLFLNWTCFCLYVFIWLCCWVLNYNSGMNSFVISAHPRILSNSWLSIWQLSLVKMLIPWMKPRRKLRARLLNLWSHLTCFRYLKI